MHLIAAMKNSGTVTLKDLINGVIFIVILTAQVMFVYFTLKNELSLTTQKVLLLETYLVQEQRALSVKIDASETRTRKDIRELRAVLLTNNSLLRKD